MTKLWVALLALGATSVFAQSAFNGTWRAINGSMEYHGSNKYSLQNGFWRCDSCVPRIAIKADGREYRINSSLYYGAAYADTESVREVNDHSIEIIDKVGWKVVGVNKFSTSGDGKTLTTDWKNGKESGKFDSERVGSAPAGGNKISGEWRPVRTNTSEGEITCTYKLIADGLIMSDPTGDSYTAKFDGKEYPFKGDPGITSVTVKKIDENTVEETYLRKGKVITVALIAVDPNGETMKVTVEDKLRKATITWTANKL